MGLRFLPHVHPVPRDADVTVSPDVRDRFVTNCRWTRFRESIGAHHLHAIITSRTFPTPAPDSKVISVTPNWLHPNSGTHPPLPRPVRGSSPPSSRLHPPRPGSITASSTSARPSPGPVHLAPPSFRLHPPRRAGFVPYRCHRIFENCINAGEKLHICSTGIYMARNSRTPPAPHLADIPEHPREGGTGVTPRRHSRTHTVDAGASGNAKPPPPETRRRGRRCQIAGVGQSSTSPCAGRS